MSTEYIANVIAFLTQHREQYFADSILRAFIQTMGDQLLFGDPGQGPGGRARGPAWSELTAQEWVEATPLMRALRRRAASTTS